MPAKQTAKTKEPFILTDALTKQMERLYLSGVTKYTEIASELDIPYKAVNRYMTKWKHRNGLLQKHRQITTDPTAIALKPTADEAEVNFLRQFYISHVGLML